jgi:hypothetical protein
VRALEIHPPTIGQIVHYKLTDTDADLITQRREIGVLGNPVAAGDVYPAFVVRTFGGDTINLQVLLDGDDSYWATSRKQGESADGKDPVPGSIPHGTWCWPPRV